MVKYKLKEKTDSLYIYEYFPEGDFSKAAGTIVVDIRAESIYLEKAAEDDFECNAAIKELNELRDSINKMRNENGEPQLTEEELPLATEDAKWYFYAEHAIDQLRKLFNESREPTEGTIAWY